MSYTTGQRIVLHDGKRRGTVAHDAAAHSSVLVLWDGTDTARWELPECVMLQEKQPAQSIKNAWTQTEKARAQNG